MDRDREKRQGRRSGKILSRLGQIELIGRADLGTRRSYDVPACVPAYLRASAHDLP